MYALVDPVRLHVSEDLEVLLHEVQFVVEEACKIAELLELILLNSIHPGTDVFCTFLAANHVSMRFCSYQDLNILSRLCVLELVLCFQPVLLLLLLIIPTLLQFCGCCVVGQPVAQAFGES